MARGGLRGAATAWLALIALQTVGSSGGSGRVASLFGDVNRLVKAAIDPTVPAIRDHRLAAPAPATGAGGGSSNDHSAPGYNAPVPNTPIPVPVYTPDSRPTGAR